MNGLDALGGFGWSDIQRGWSEVHEAARPYVETAADKVPVLKPFIEAGDAVEQAATGIRPTRPVHPSAPSPPAAPVAPAVVAVPSPPVCRDWLLYGVLALSAGALWHMLFGGTR